MQILCKFPSRQRPHKFFLCIKKYIDLQTTNDVRYLITLDKDDNLLLAYTNYCETLKSQGVNLEYVVGESTGKIHAVNRDMDDAGDWDILVLGSDDMQCVYHGWDNVLQTEMKEHYPDTDGVLFHKDGFTELNTMVIAGRLYLDKLSFMTYELSEIAIYHPDYVSLWCDNEFMDVSRQLGKETIFETVLFKHEHYSNGSQFHHTKDALMNKTEKYYRQDKEVYERRKSFNFGLDD